MPDDADRASILEEKMREHALRKRRPEPKPCGYCLNCNEPCRDLYCSPECLEDGEKRRHFESRNLD